MNKFFLRAMYALLTLSLLLTACGKQQDSDLADIDPNAPSYSGFFNGDVVASSLLIGYSTKVAEASFRAPDVYVGADMDGAPLEWTVDRFALLDMDGDDVSELILAISSNGNEEYVILTRYDGTLYANQLVYRSFLEPKADGTFGFSGGALDNGCARARFEHGVLNYENFAVMSGNSDGSRSCTLNGKQVSEEEYDAFLSEQDSKEDLSWTEFSLDAVKCALAE